MLLLYQMSLEQNEDFDGFFYLLFLFILQLFKLSKVFFSFFYRDQIKLFKHLLWNYHIEFFNFIVKYACVVKAGSRYCLAFLRTLVLVVFD